MNHDAQKHHDEIKERAAEAARAAVLLNVDARGRERSGWRAAPALVVASGWGGPRQS